MSSPVFASLVGSGLFSSFACDVPGMSSYVTMELCLTTPLRLSIDLLRSRTTRFGSLSSYAASVF